MGREIKRVPLDFDHPLDEVWPGYLSPDSLGGLACATCVGTGYALRARQLKDKWYGYVPFSPAETGSTPLTIDTPEVRAFAERHVQQAPEYYGIGEFAIRREAARLAELWNGQWCHHLTQEDVDALVEAGRLFDFTHYVVPGVGWVPKDPKPTVTAAEVNAWSLASLGHDGINCGVVIEARCKREGRPSECPKCGGHGEVEAYPGQRAEADAWQRTEPPSGDGWQLWETVSDGAPISPVFASAEDLATWMSTRPTTEPWFRDPVDYDTALRFIQAGWAPTIVRTEEGVLFGVQAVGRGD